MPDDDDQPTGTSLLNHRARTPSPRRGRTETTVSCNHNFKTTNYFFAYCFIKCELYKCEKV